MVLDTLQSPWTLLHSKSGWRYIRITQSHAAESHNGGGCGGMREGVSRVCKKIVQSVKFPNVMRKSHAGVNYLLKLLYDGQFSLGFYQHLLRYERHLLEIGWTVNKGMRQRMANNSDSVTSAHTDDDGDDDNTLKRHEAMHTERSA